MTSYRAGKLLVRLLFGCVMRVHVIRPENANRPGASTLEHIAGVPILTCVILGSDRLYSIKSRKLSALRRTPVWIAFGNPISHSPGLEKSEARERVESELASSFKNLYGELQQT